MTAESARRWRDNNPGKAQEYDRIQKEKNPEKKRELQERYWASLKRYRYRAGHRLLSPLDTRELAWAAGLFEGEGYISLRFELVLRMADKDVVDRFQKAVGGLGHRSVVQRSLPLKTIYGWGVGAFEETQAVIAMLWFGLGERRRARYIEALAARNR